MSLNIRPIFLKVIICLFVVACSLYFFSLLDRSEHQKKSLPTSLKNVYVYASQWGQMFNINNPANNRDNCLQPLWQLYQAAEKDGYHLQQINSVNSLKDFEYLFIFEVPVQEIEQLAQYPKEKLILFLWEPASVMPDNYDARYHQYFNKIYTWNDELVDHKKYFKFYYPVLNPPINHSLSFEDRKLCTLIACNKNSSHPHELYSERLKVIQFFEDQHQANFDLYGKWWPDYFQTYQGSIEKKVDILKKYRFSFAYENIKEAPGYITEKIFDCFQAGTVPIYWGASNIEDYVPNNCFIDRRNFSDQQELYDYLLTINEDNYNLYLKNIKKFLKSDRAQVFSSEHFTHTLLELIKESPSKNKET